MKLLTRLATFNDLPAIKKLFTEIITNKDINQYVQWGEYYPFMMFEKDITQKHMFLIENENEIVSIFVLAKDNDHEDEVNWFEKTKDMFYLYRFTLNAKYVHQGLGKPCLKLVEEKARELNGNYLRLFVIYTNTPAEKLYLRNGYTKKDGEYFVHEDPSVRLFAFEKKII